MAWAGLSFFFGILGGWCCFSEVVPSLAIFFVAGHAAFAGREDLHAGDVLEYFDRDHIPNIVRHDVANNEIYIFDRVAAAVNVAAGMEAYPFMALVWADLTCTRQQRPPVSTMKS